MGSQSQIHWASLGRHALKAGHAISYMSDLVISSSKTPAIIVLFVIVYSHPLGTGNNLFQLFLPWIHHKELIKLVFDRIIKALHILRNIECDIVFSGCCFSLRSLSLTLLRWSLRGTLEQVLYLLNEFAERFLDLSQNSFFFLNSIIASVLFLISFSFFSIGFCLTLAS